MAIHIQQAAAVSSTSTGLASIWDQPGIVFLATDGEVYVTPATMASGGGYITVIRVRDSANHDLQSNSVVKVAQGATLVVSF